jgi:iron complex outermembrane recepter protein
MHPRALCRPPFGHCLATLALSACATTGHAADPSSTPGGPSQDLTELSLEELASLEVVSVQKRPQALKDATAAVTVISGKEIAGSGATSIPALLRRVPGMHVARLDSSQWAMGIRGFTNSVARAQLAVQDGRSLYTPLFAGTYWDVQNPFLEDVDQIEVVRGPGGTLWGANAVTGIINIITKDAGRTQGGLVALGGGNEERGFGRARFGGRWRGGTAYRVYGAYFNRAPQDHRTTPDYDGWHMYQGGFRIDWTRTPAETLTVQGDLYRGQAGRRNTFASFTAPYVTTLEEDARLSGGNLRTRWRRTLGEGREVNVQGYYDRTNRQEPNFSEGRDTFDLDAQCRLALPARQELVFGLGYRVSDGRTRSVPTLAFLPPDRTDDLASAFVEDTLQLVPGRLRLALGTKVEWNDYSGFELQPSVRLAFNATARHGLWLALTRAVRTPTRFDRDLVLNVAAAPGRPVFARLLGDPRFDTERARALEAGYRAQLSPHLSLDVAGFYNRYPNLVSYEAGAPFVEAGRVVLPLRTANGTVGTVGGVEASADVRPAERWLLRAGYSYLNMRVSPQLSSNDSGSGAVEDGSPRHQVFVSSTASLPRRVSLDALWRWVARLPSQDVPAYSELDVHVRWRATEHVELALAGQNLLHPRHLEFGTGSIGGADRSDVRIRRAVYAQATFHW